MTQQFGRSDRDPEWYQRMLADKNLNPYGEMSPSTFRDLFEQKWEYTGPDFSRSFLRGDNLEKIVSPPRGETYGTTTPMPVTVGEARAVVEQFIKERKFTHDAIGSTAWIIVRYCEEANVGCEICATSHRKTLEPIGFITYLR